MSKKFVYKITETEGNTGIKKGSRVLEDKYRGEEFTWIITGHDNTYKGRATGVFTGEREITTDPTTQMTLIGKKESD